MRVRVVDDAVFDVGHASRVVEVSSHEKLVAANGQFAELYAIQAAAYR